MCVCEFVRGNQARATVDLSAGRHLAAYQTNHHAGAVIIIDPQWVREEDREHNNQDCRFSFYKAWFYL
jgi:hypothetical protein